MPVVLKTNDFDELQEVAEEGWDFYYRPLETGPFQATLATAFADDCRIDYEMHSHSSEVTGTATPDTWGFCVSAHQGRQYSTFGMTAGDSQLLIVPPGADFHLVTESGSALVSFLVPADNLEQVAGGALGDSLPIPGNDSGLIQFTEAGLRPFRKALASAANMQSDRWQPRSTWVREELTGVLIDLLLQSSDSTVQCNPGARYRVGRQARDIMLRDLTNPPSLLEVCQELSVSPRTLHYSFNEVFGTSPKSYLKRQRLRAVRQAIQKAGDKQSISRLMTRFGFFDSGHFAKDYRQMFGELPRYSRGRRCGRRRDGSLPLTLSQSSGPSENSHRG